MSETVISFQNVFKAFDNVHALNGLSFDVRSGELCGLLGPNGSGKSTTLRIMTSLVKADDGEISIFNLSVAAKRIRVLSRIGTLIERPDFYEHFTARRNLKLVAAYGNIRTTDQDLDDLLQTVGLAGREDHLVTTYSEGMKQRLGLAQALLGDPELIILDEPFSSLDPQGVKDIRDLLLALNREKGKTILLSSHNLAEVEKVASRVVLIRNGSNVREYTSDEIARLRHDSQLSLEDLFLKTVDN